MGRGNSGKLVTAVKLALFQNAPETDVAIIDGSPGIGCPVISSVSGYGPGSGGSGTLGIRPARPGSGWSPLPPRFKPGWPCASTSGTPARKTPPLLRRFAMPGKFPLPAGSPTIPPQEQPSIRAALLQRWTARLPAPSARSMRPPCVCLCLNNPSIHTGGRFRRYNIKGVYHYENCCCCYGKHGFRPFRPL